MTCTWYEHSRFKIQDCTFRDKNRDVTPNPRLSWNQLHSPKDEFHPQFATQTLSLSLAILLITPVANQPLWPVTQVYFGLNQLNFYKFDICYHSYMCIVSILFTCSPLCLWSPNSFQMQWPDVMTSPAHLHTAVLVQEALLRAHLFNCIIKGVRSAALHPPVNHYLLCQSFNHSFSPI